MNHEYQNEAEVVHNGKQEYQNEAEVVHNGKHTAVYTH